MANEIKPKDTAPAATGKLLSSLYGSGGSNYRSMLTAEAKVTKTVLGQVRGVLGYSDEVTSIVNTAPRAHGLPRPDDVMRNQMVMDEMKQVNKLKQELEQRLGHKLELKPGQKLTVPGLTMQLEELKQKQHLELKHKLYHKLTPPGAPK